MDQPAVQSEPSGLTYAGLSFLVLFIIFGILNYFNIFPLYKLFPNQFGWMPHKEVSFKSSIFKTNNQSAFYLSCPLARELCSKGQIVFSKSGYYQGLGFNLPEKTPLLAPFSGTYEIFEQTTNKASSSSFMLLRLKAGNYSVFFTYPAIGSLTNDQKIELKKPKKVKQGEEMTTISKGVVSIYEGIYNFVFYVNREEGTAPPVTIHLKPSSLSQEEVELDNYK